MRQQAENGPGLKVDNKQIQCFELLKTAIELNKIYLKMVCHVKFF
jgi:hypothetical protein